MPLFTFPDFYKKKSLLSCSFFVNKRQFSKKNCSDTYILSKNVYSLENLVLSCHFSQIFSWKTPCSFPYLLKNINSVKTTQYYGPKKSIGYHFFWFFKKKSQLQSHICPKKCPLSYRHTAHEHTFCQKNCQSIKATVLLYHFVQIFHENPLLLCPIQRIVEALLENALPVSLEINKITLNLKSIIQFFFSPIYAL